MTHTGRRKAGEHAMRHRLIIPGRLPGLNEYISAERTHRQQGAMMKRESQRIICAEIQQQLNGVHFTGPVKMHYLWIERDMRRDKDNISSFGRKVIQDALVTCHVLAGDGWRHISGFEDAFAVDAKKPRIEVEMDDETD